MSDERALEPRSHRVVVPQASIADGALMLCRLQRLTYLLTYLDVNTAMLMVNGYYDR